MGHLFGGAPSVPAIATAPPPPPQYPNESAASATAQQQADAAKGAASTIATSAQGVQKRSTLGTTSLIGD
jgi:hypothetical protein